MIDVAIGLAIALVAAAGPSLQADFPAAQITESPAGRVTQMSGFSAPRLGETPEAAARAFLRRYATSFGIVRRETLVVKRKVAPGVPGAVAFERRIDGLPVHNGDIIVGVDGAGAVILVNATALPSRITGGFRVSRSAAIKAALLAIPGLKISGPIQADRGWYGQVDCIRPVWRVDFTSGQPAGDWRSYVDAQTGDVLFQLDRRALGPAAAPASTGIAPFRP